MCHSDVYDQIFNLAFCDLKVITSRAEICHIEEYFFVANKQTNKHLVFVSSNLLRRLNDVPFLNIL